jgi:alkylation response protein AidB-like acyl-CoA dehydrogenase
MVTAMVTGARSDDTLSLFRESVRGTLERRWPPDRALALGDDSAALTSLWREAGAQGWIAAASAGDGGGLSAALVVLEELGRAHCPLPLLDSAVVAAAALRNAPAAIADEWRSQLDEGSAALAVGLGDQGGDQGGGGAAATLLAGPSPATVSGRFRFIEVSPGTTHILVVAEPGPVAALVSVSAKGVTLTSTPGMAAPPLCDVELCDAEAGVWEIDATVVDDMAALGRLGCCARALGAAQRAHELAVDHAKTRQQFGSPIGRFQAIQHRLADGRTLLDASRLLIERAAASRDAGGRHWRMEVSAATAFAGPSLRRVVRDVQHVLAGVGYIEEHEAPRHFRQVHADTVRYGGAAAGREELAAFALD